MNTRRKVAAGLFVLIIVAAIVVVVIVVLSNQRYNGGATAAPVTSSASDATIQRIAATSFAPNGMILQWSASSISIGDYSPLYAVTVKAPTGAPSGTLPFGSLYTGADISEGIVVTPRYKSITNLSPSTWYDLCVQTQGTTFLPVGSPAIITVPTVSSTTSLPILDFASTCTATSVSWSFSTPYGTASVQHYFKEATAQYALLSANQSPPQGSIQSGSESNLKPSTLYDILVIATDTANNITPIFTRVQTNAS